jgi:hypothetical protein
MRSGMNLLAGAITALGIMAIGAVIGGVWTAIGITRIAAPAWLAMDLGVVVTLAVGVGVMALVVIGNGRSYRLVPSRVPERSRWRRDVWDGRYIIEDEVRRLGAEVLSLDNQSTGFPRRRG